MPDIEFIEPQKLIEYRLKPPTLKTHALSWRVNTKIEGYVQKRVVSLNLIPDSVFGLRFKRNNTASEKYFFLEADRATMPIKRSNLFRSSFYKKMVGYLASYKTGLFSKYFGFKKVRVLTVTKSGERIQSMIKANKELHDLGNGYALFLFAKYEDIDLKKPERIFRKIWINGKSRKDKL